MTEGGLFGTVMTWMLEMLPYLDEKQIYPDWVIKCPAYSTPPSYNIIGTLLEPNYTPEFTGRVIDIKDLKQQYWNDSHIYGNDFQKAHDLFFKYFKLNEEKSVIPANEFMAQFSGAVLGVHYRGTDKNTDLDESSGIAELQFIEVINDTLAAQNISNVALVTDDSSFLKHIDKIKGNVIVSEGAKSTTSLWQSAKVNDFDNTHLGYEAIKDALILSKCDYAIKCQSALSAWAKIFNPNLEIYRATSFFYGWFPDGYIPLLKSGNIQSLLNDLQSKEKASV